MPKFEVVSKYKNSDIDLIPKRGTDWSAGYDFVAAEDIVIPPYSDLISKLWRTNLEIPRNFEGICYRDSKIYTLDEMAAFTKETKCKPTLIPTGIKCKLAANSYLMLVSRSSSPLKYWLVQANAPGIIDADYYNNPDNEGHIFFQVINFSPFPIWIHKGDKICQGIIQTYHKTDDEILNTLEQTKSRKGGFGSTDDNVN